MNATYTKFLLNAKKELKNVKDKDAKKEAKIEINYLMEVSMSSPRAKKPMDDYPKNEMGELNCQVETHSEYGWDSSYFKLENKANLKDRFLNFMFCEYPQCMSFDVWNEEWAWGKFISTLTKQEEEDSVRKIKLGKKGYLNFLTDKFKCNILDVVYYFCTINYVRELCYNNNWGICVVEPKSKKYPENEVINTVRDIILEQLTKEPSYMRNKVLTMLDAAPVNSFAKKIWDSIPNAKEHDIDMGDCVPAFSGTWEKTVAKMVKSGGKRRPQYTPYIEFIADTRKDTQSVLDAINAL